MVCTRLTHIKNTSRDCDESRNNNNSNNNNNNFFFIKNNTNLYLRISKPTPFTRINTNKKM